MNDTFKHTHMKGEIELYSVQDDVWTFNYKQHNLIAYDGSDVLAKALAGDLNINLMYLVFENDPAAVRISEGLANDAATYAATSPNRSFVRVSTIGEPVYSASTSNYVNNKVVFLGITDGTTQVPSVPVTDGTSVFYHSALVASVEGAAQDEDKIFSCSDLTTEITKIAGAQIGIRWTITFVSA